MAEIKWEREFCAALERAKGAKKSIYLNFWFERVTGCIAMNAGPYSSEKVQQYIEEQFIPVKSECFWDKRTDLMRRFAVKWTPTLLVLDAKGRSITGWWGTSPMSVRIG